MVSQLVIDDCKMYMGTDASALRASWCVTHSINYLLNGASQNNQCQASAGEARCSAGIYWVIPFVMQCLCRCGSEGLDRTPDLRL